MDFTYGDGPHVGAGKGERGVVPTDCQEATERRPCALGLIRVKEALLAAPIMGAGLSRRNGGALP